MTEENKDNKFCCMNCGQICCSKGNTNCNCSTSIIRRASDGSTMLKPSEYEAQINKLQESHHATLMELQSQ